MPITRDQASRLLTQPEMGLFGDSRNPALRALSEKALTSRVERTRKLRDKSRDMLQRQKLKSRERTGSKLGISGDANARTSMKAEILEDILQRFEVRLKKVQSAGGTVAPKTGKPKTGATSRKTSAPKTTPRKPAAKNTAGPAVKKRQAASAKPGTAAMVSAPAKAARTAKSAAASPKKPAKRAASKTAITPKIALKNTRALLEAKQQRKRQPPAYVAIDTHAAAEQPNAGFQSSAAKSKAQELHHGESRMDPIHGSISTRGRKNQGKRDNR